MKDTLTDANFPRTDDLRVYHLGLKAGEVANRIITVGSPSRANGLASLLDAEPKPFVLSSERGFLTITGRFRNVPVSIVSIGMGSPNMDFFIREVRECVTGDMVIIRLGSCGGLVDIPVGSVVVPKASVAINRNVDFDFVHPEDNREPAYRISKPVSADPELHETVRKAVQGAKPPQSQAVILTGTVNASADSFYSSQGRQTSFPDHNEDLIAHLLQSNPEAATLEMETFHLFHLAHCWSGHSAKNRPSATAPLTTGPVKPVMSQRETSSQPVPAPASQDTVIKAAAVQMVFASRTSQDFIKPNEVSETERWTGQVCSRSPHSPVDFRP
ncbi:uridine phosphorylase [Coprinopsis cinerea okayama7|uniref:Uridine phosphorylase n=1 Tax=Coprinopsis cinerea (strain Okayama-7 / 130 / ATCC MYA-4618 / FGSC 9003) TaxID=240176 RepID=A8NLI6_COPC7|nr:uridine phosphorylase [Coprinopsis cinerea okayama7\|eukprot:XP_001834696.2 uridine phosphorylase [Coprinopsis cinerea okayama7\